MILFYKTFYYAASIILEVKIQVYLPLLMSSDKLEADNWENDYLDRYFVNIFQIWI